MVVFGAAMVMVMVMLVRGGEGGGGVVGMALTDVSCVWAGAWDADARGDKVHESELHGVQVPPDQGPPVAQGMGAVCFVRGLVFLGVVGVWVRGL